MPARKGGKPTAGGPCGHCGATHSPAWRKGPRNKPELCNACGTRFSRVGRLDGYMPNNRRVTRIEGRVSANMKAFPGMAVLVWAMEAVEFGASAVVPRVEGELRW